MEPRLQHPKYLDNTGDDLESEKFTTERRQPKSTDFNTRQNNKKNVPERQLRDAVNETDKMVETLLSETERFHEVLAEKGREIERLHNLNAPLTKTKQDLRAKSSLAKNEDRLESSYAAKQEIRPVVAIARGTTQTTDAVKRLSLINAELSEEVALLREMVSTTERTLQKERHSYKWLKAKVEELISLNDNLNNRLREKEDRINTLEGETHKKSISNEKLAQELKGKNYVIEELRKSLVIVDFQSPQHLAGKKSKDDFNGIVSSFTKEANSTTWSTLKMESPSGLLADKTKDDFKESQKRYESVRNDNARLIKLVEENQRTIKDLREAFADLEKRSSARYSDVKAIYEDKIRHLIEERKTF